MKIGAPGIYAMSAARYHEDPCVVPSLSSSIARTLITSSPLHAWTAHPRLNPNYASGEKTAFDTGSAAHALLLEGADRMVSLPYDDYRKKECQEARDHARAEGKHPVLSKVYEDIFKMREVALRKIADCPDLSGLTLAGGKAEETLIWQEGEVFCRARVDWMTNERDVILDYKTTKALAEPDAWTRTMIGMGGEMQAAFYLRGNEATCGPSDAKFIFLVQEITPPYACALIGMSPPFVDLGMAKVREAVDTWRTCVQSNSWPAYPKRICWIEPPPWHAAKWQERAPGAGIPYDVEKLWGADKVPEEGDLIV